MQKGLNHGLFHLIDHNEKSAICVVYVEIDRSPSGFTVSVILPFDSCDPTGVTARTASARSVTQSVGFVSSLMLGLSRAASPSFDFKVI